MKRIGSLVVCGAAVVMAMTTAGCVTEDQSTGTLPPLVPRSTSQTTGADTAVEDDQTFTTPLSVEPTVLPAASTSIPSEARPVGDWDGAKFDVGRITGTGEVTSYPAIMFDRYSYDDPQAGAVDAEAFTEEPVRYWWVEEPFFNISTTVRRFVLAPNVQVLVLADAGANQACSTPRPDPLPEPTWTPVETSYLQSENANQAFASLSYSDDGLVERIRFTRGC